MSTQQENQQTEGKGETKQTNARRTIITESNTRKDRRKPYWNATAHKQKTTQRRASPLYNKS